MVSIHANGPCAASAANAKRRHRWNIKKKKKVLDIGSWLFFDDVPCFL